jgi:hypothetical protein
MIWCGLPLTLRPFLPLCLRQRPRRISIPPPNLVAKAGSGLAKCNVSEVIKAETAANCSCCASQLCGREAYARTNEAIASLMEQQRNFGITPQCDVNGKLCATP